MPDADRPRELTDPPADWSTAFAALPQATPPQHGWHRLAEQLPTPAHSTRARSASRPRSPVWLATAASLALAAAVPFALMEPAPDTTPSPSPTAPAPAPAPATGSVARISTPPSPTAGAQTQTVPAAAVVEPDTAASSPQAQTRVAVVEPSPVPAQGDRAPASSPDIEEVHPVAVTDDRPEIRLAGVQQESARLEALLAMAHDDRVGSGTGAMLAAQLQSHLSQIDGVLASDTIDDDERLALWNARVDTLRDLTGLETTERWFAAEGRAYDTALVQVH